MSLIPPDESRGDGRRTPETVDSERSVATRLRVLVASLVGTLAAAVERLVTGYSTTAVTEAEPGSPVSSDIVVEGGLARQERSPDRAVGAEMELVSTETDEELTVQEADNADASITSDTWVSIER